MSYQHDVFISYKRELNWTDWTRAHFKELLKSYLQQDLGRPPEVFLDERLESDFGIDWVKGLGEHLATARVAIVLFSRDYFVSDWCLHELDLMLERAQKIVGGTYPESRLIIPVIGHDGELIPDIVARIAPCDVRDYRITCINKHSLDYHEFSKRIRNLSPKVAQAINDVPAFDPAWIPECINRFEEVYEAQSKGNRLPTRRFAPKPFRMLTVPPRLTTP
jgi:hypothetical protein